MPAIYTISGALDILSRNADVKQFIQYYMRHVKSLAQWPSQFDYTTAIVLALRRMGYLH